MVAVDFTASNKQPTDPASLHYMAHPNVLNEYLQVNEKSSTSGSNSDPHALTSVVSHTDYT